MSVLRRLRPALGMGALAGFLALPIVGVRVSGDGSGVAEFRLAEVGLVALGVFAAVAARLAMPARAGDALAAALGPGTGWRRAAAQVAGAPHARAWGLAALLAAAALFPFVFSAYQVSVLTTALIFVVLGLGLNIVVGLAGLLDLGYVAFYAVGAYTFALLYEYHGLGFWAALPVAGLLAAVTGVILGIPVLRLRGDYLAIVTLGFGEIIRLTLENWSTVTKGPAGISGIPAPTVPGVELGFAQAQVFTYLVALVLTVFTAVIVRRLDHSRLGRAWIALREDEVACQAIGIDRTRAKLTAFALGACWAGFVGALFAAKTSYVNPGSFTFLHSAIILCIVVLGGMGSITGVVIAALVISLLPEYLRFFSEYRMFAFGIVLVAMMLFRPGGLVARVPPRYDPGGGGG